MAKDSRHDDALAAIAYHGSIRKAAAATGLSKSTLHRISQQPQAHGVPSQAKAPARSEKVEASAGASPDEGQLYNKPPEPQGDERNINVLWVRAFYRYAHLIANGVPRQYALPAAKQIATDFELLPGEDAQIAASIKQLNMSEGLYLPEEPAEDVLEDVERHSMDDGDVDALAGALYQAKSEAYLLGLNDQLLKLGSSRVADITDPGVTEALRDNTSDIAEVISNVWNRSVAQRAAQTYLFADTAQARPALASWVDAQMEWKPAAWSTQAIHEAYNQGARDFQERNGVASMGRISPAGVADCCQELVDMGPMPAHVLMNVQCPSHPGCEHFVDWDLGHGDSSTPYWAAQAG